MKTLYLLVMGCIVAAMLNPILIRAQGNLVITEIHYNPCSEQGGDSDFEFVEIHNPSANSVQLEGHVFTGAFTHEFPPFELVPGAFLVLTANALSYADLGIDVMEWDSGSINNTGETITLLHPEGSVVDEVSYSSTGSWPDANGSCFSLELSDPFADNTDPANWCAVSWFGTPGMASACNNLTPGCTDPSACNYDPDANSNDGSCTFPPSFLDCLGMCQNDSDNDGICDEIEGLNLNMLCGAGTEWDPVSGRCVAADGCPYDLTGDATSSTNDILVLLSHFGEVCEP